MKNALTFLFMFLSISLLAQTSGKWNLDPNGTYYTDSLILKDTPRKIEFLLASYEGSASVMYDSGFVKVGNIRWGGTMNINGYGGSLNVTLEESIFKKNGKLAPHWEARTKEMLTKAILSELEYYK